MIPRAQDHDVALAHPRASNEDAALVARARAGDPASRERLAREHLPRLLELCDRVAGSVAAREAVRLAFDAAFHGTEPFDASCGIAVWLRRLALRAVLPRDARREETEGIERLLPTFTDDGHREPAADAGRDGSGPEGGLRRRIDQLPGAFRLVLLLRDVERLSLAETAELLALPVERVRERLHLARLALCEHLARDTTHH